jgi:hypothetical protein
LIIPDEDKVKYGLCVTFGLKISCSSEKTTYVSEITQFIDELKTKNPKLEARSAPAAPCCGTRNRWTWTSPPVKASRVAQQPYVYQSH